MNANGTRGAAKGAASGNMIDKMMQAGRLVFDARVPFSLKLMLPIAAVLYWLWPLDLMPGLPFDDVAVLFIALTFFVQLANQALEKQQSATGTYTNPTPGQSSSRNTGSGEGSVVDTTWRVIE
jgi:uncharacterized membrane protein YkvA (DUF1232 family)